ncbi:MAG TPA: IS110 family transposase [Symbiobacteriaceae bacterium]|nr:IS110 family transposase [Symbiobacteriaceae bacterium]
MSSDAKLEWMHSEGTVIAGVDMAKRVPWAQIINLKGLNVGNPFPFENNLHGFRRLVQSCEEAKKRVGATRVVVAVESTGHYWKPLARYLKAAGIIVVLVNPFHVKRTKETEDNTPAKNDRKDARLIASMAKDGKFLTCMLPTGHYADLRWLSHSRRDKVRSLNAVVNRLHAFLDQFFPEFPQIFRRLLDMTPLRLLEICPFPCDVVKYTDSQLFQKLKDSGLCARKKTLERVREAAAISVGLTEGREAGHLVLEGLLAEIRFWQDQVARLEQAMADTLAATGIGQYLVSIPGVGPISAAIFLGEVGDPRQFEDWRQIRRLAGLNLVNNSSGDRTGQKRISKRGRPYLRAILYQMCAVMIAWNREFKAMYQYFRARKFNQLKGKEALVALISKLLRVIHTLVKNRKYYDPAQVMGPVRAHQLATAA